MGVVNGILAILKSVEEVKAYFLGYLVPYENEILETMMANLFDH